MQEHESLRTRHRDSGLRTGPSLSCDRLSRHKSRLLNAGVSASDRLGIPICSALALRLRPIVEPSFSHATVNFSRPWGTSC